MLVATAKIIPANVGTGPPALFLCPLVEVDFFANYFALSNLLSIDIYGCYDLNYFMSVNGILKIDPKLSLMLT
jgi:hypothetical protein